MNSIIVSETCTAPTAPVQVPLTQLSPLSQTCLSCPSSVHPLPPQPPHSPLALSFTDTSIFQSLCRSTSPKPLHFTSLFPWQSRRWGSVLFFLAPRKGVGGERCPSQPPLRLRARTFWRWCGRRDTVQFGLVGVEFGHGSLALVEEHNGATTSQRNALPP